jgi:hypothetical protein
MTKAKTPRPLNWFRRQVPAGYQQATLVLNGASPLLVKSGEFDPDGEQYRAFEHLSMQRSKTQDEKQRLRELEWRIALYFDAEIGPYIPAKNLMELLREAATKWRKGEEVRRSLRVIDYRVPILYDGPREESTLWEAGYRKNLLVSNGGVNRGRVFRCRPMFEEWALAAEIAYDPEELDFDTLELVVARSQRFGLGDGRAIGFGAFSAELQKGDLHKAATNGSALKPRDRELVLAHLANLERVMVEAP